MEAVIEPGTCTTPV